MWNRTPTPRFKTEQPKLLKAARFCREGFLRTLYEVEVWRKGVTASGFTHGNSQIARLPDFILIGAQRAGTTSLWENLRGHPDIRLPAAKELHFFDFNFDRGVSWYKSQFRHCTSSHGSAHIGEASPYYIYHPHVASRCAELLPLVKIIAILRNPVDRAYSHYNHEIRLKQEWLSFEEAIDAEPSRLQGETERMASDDSYHSLEHIHHSYLGRGQYATQLEAWRQRFAPEQILLVCSEQLFRDPTREYERVLEFLGLSSVPLHTVAEKNKGQYTKMLPQTRQRLITHFAPHNHRLYNFLKRAWSPNAIPEFARYWDR